MAQSTDTNEKIIDVILSSAKSTGLWSFVAAIIGVVALIAGGIIYLTIEPIRDFAISVIVISLVLLFLALILSPRAVAIFLIGRQGRFGANVILMTVAFFAIFILINFLLFRNATRIDVTATRVLTLSPQTLAILNDLESPVQANAFFVPGDPRVANVRQRAEDLLNEFQRHSTNFNQRFIDPDLQKGIADKYNVTESPVIVFEDLNSGNIQPVSLFEEQDFVTGILVATGEEQKLVYSLTGHNEATLTRDLSGGISEDGFDLAIQGIQNDNHRVRPLNLKQFSQVPEDAAVLLIAGPQSNLDGEEFTAITNYIKGGGRVLALLDPGSPESFVDLFLQWGVSVGDLGIADIISNISEEAMTPLIQRSNVQYFPSSVSNITITDQLDSTFFPQVTSVQPVRSPQDQPPFITFAPLAATTPGSWIESNPDDVNFTLGEDVRGPFFIAAAVTATGTIDEREFHEEAKMVIFGDSDFARNRFYASVNNADFILNSVNWLAEDYDLISIHAKLVPVRELVVNKRERDFIQWTSWFVPPIVMLLLGTIVWWRRR